MENILIVDDDIAIVESLKFALKKDYNLSLDHDTTKAMEHYLNKDIAVTILDLKLGNEDGMEIFKKIREINPKAIVIILTGYGTIKSSIEAIKSGVFYYLTKPIDLKELKILIEKGIEINNLYKKINILDNKSKNKYEEYGVIAKSQKMKSVLNTVEKVKDIDSNILITGESGTGKGLIAKMIHNYGNRKAGRFNTINCAAIPKELLESELFGYKKGAFTGARYDKKGYFELSNGGTLFLDEIGDMDMSLQGKLLRAIQEKVVTPLGSEEEISLDIMLITATNRDLFSLVKEGEFREDLFYRLNVINIEIPPLKDRKEDIPPLINHFVYKYSKILDKEIDRVDYDFINVLENYDFKGNIRELENLIERAIALSENRVLTKEDILSHLNKRGESQLSLDKKLIPIFVGEDFKTIERKVIEVTYKACNFNQRETADILGITDRTIRNKLKKYKEENHSD